MGVGILQGDPLEILSPSQTFGGAAGRIIALNNIVWWSLMASEIKITTTATAGNRAFIIQINDANGNVIVKSTNPTAQPASNTWSYQFGAGIATIGTNSTFSWSTPCPTLIPPGSSIQILDQSNIDPNDTFSAAFFFGT